MQIPRERIIDLVRRHGDARRVADAEQILPKMIDVDLDADLLRRFGLDPSQVRKLSRDGRGGD